MATPNYGYEKRQRELAKKRKKEEKAARKAAGVPEPTPGADEPADDAAPAASGPDAEDKPAD